MWPQWGHEQCTQNFGGKPLPKTEMQGDESTDRIYYWITLLQCDWVFTEVTKTELTTKRATSLCPILQYVFHVPFLQYMMHVHTHTYGNVYVYNHQWSTLRFSCRIITERENLISVIFILFCFQELCNMKQASIPHQTIYLYFAFLSLYCVTVALMSGSRLCLVLHTDGGIFKSKFQ